MKPGVNGRTDGVPAQHAPSIPVSLEIRGLVLLFAVLFAFCAKAATTDPLVLEQLERMATAMRTLSYEGTLVYLHDNRLETLRVIHRIENGQVQERLVSLNGPVRTVTRGQEQVTCELSESHSISIQRQGVAREMMRSRAIDPEVLSANYLIRPLGATRVAGRKTTVVGIIPRDDLRYGYRFYLDRESGLPLKSDLMGQAAEPLEQIMFTSLDIFPLDEEEAAPVAGRVGDRQGVLSGGNVEAVAPGAWRFAELPAGFRLVMQDRWHPASEQRVEHFVLSDGLASVSVYVENGSQEGLKGGSRIGAVHAAGGRVDGYQVTVVGEVPAATVEAVLAGVRYDGGGRP